MRRFSLIMVLAVASTQAVGEDHDSLNHPFPEFGITLDVPSGWEASSTEADILFIRSISPAASGRVSFVSSPAEGFDAVVEELVQCRGAVCVTPKLVWAMPDTPPYIAQAFLCTDKSSVSVVRVFAVELGESRFAVGVFEFSEATWDDLFPEVVVFEESIRPSTPAAGNSGAPNPSLQRTRELTR